MVYLKPKVVSQMSQTLESDNSQHKQIDSTLSTECLNWLQDDFLTIVFQQCRNPLHNMRMAIEVLEVARHKNSKFLDRRCDREIESDKVARCLRILRTECEKQISFMNNLLDLHRLETATYLPLYTETLYLQDWLLPMLAPPYAQAEQFLEKLEIHLADNLPPIVTEPTTLRRIIVELVKTAYTSAPSGDKISLTAHAEANSLNICVSLAGGEIYASDRDRILALFSQLSSSDRPPSNETDLGLILTQKLVERLNGSIAVNIANNITRFIVELPILESCHATSSAL